MSAKKTIDVHNNMSGNVFIGVRLSVKQTADLDALAVQRNTTRSSLIRELIRKEVAGVAQ